LMRLRFEFCSKLLLLAENDYRITADMDQFLLRFTCFAFAALPILF